MNQYMERAYQLALLAYKEDEIPIGAVIVYQHKIIAEAYNTKESSKDVTCHAEILAIKKASEYFDRWHLDDCVMYSTLEPCMMCSGAIIQSRISKVIYGASTNRWDGFSKLITAHDVNHQVDYICSNDIECSKLLTDYFKAKRSQ